MKQRIRRGVGKVARDCVIVVFLPLSFTSSMHVPLLSSQTSEVSRRIITRLVRCICPPLLSSHQSRESSACALRKFRSRILFALRSSFVQRERWPPGGWLLLS